MKPRPIALAILALIGMLLFISDVLGNIVSSLLQDQLENYAGLIVIPYIIIVAVLVGFELRDRLPALLQDRRLASDRRNRQAMLDKVRAMWIAAVFEHSLAYEVPYRPGLG